MSKTAHLGTAIDQIFQGTERRPEYRVYIWNPNRTTINQVVLDESPSPKYNLTSFVTSIQLSENIVFENNDDAVASNARLRFTYLPDNTPIPISERTLMDGTPIQIDIGDETVSDSDFVTVFTGVIQGHPTFVQSDRGEIIQDQIQVLAVDRAAAFLNSVVTARSYAKGTDVGTAAKETAIERMGLDAREINFGTQNFEVGHTQAQLVDIEVLKGIFQILQTVGKKPRFDADGILIAADTDLDKAAARVFIDELVVSVTREQGQRSLNNSVKVLGLDNMLTKILERTKRLAHGNITSGWFESTVRQDVWFSENQGKGSGGRRAQDTFAEGKIGTVGDFFGESFEWVPTIEEDGFTVFHGVIKFDTGFDGLVAGILTGAYIISVAAATVFMEFGNTFAAGAAYAVAFGLLMAILLLMQEVGRVDWQVFGKPFQWVFRQLVGIAELEGLLSDQRREIEIRNDWIYDIGTLNTRARELLRRELIKGWSYKIVTIDDPIIDVDDVIEVEDSRYYVTSIERRIDRLDAPKNLMTMTCWRLS